jgi:hypothetical protein
MSSLTTNDAYVASLITEQLPFEYECVAAESEMDEHGYRYMIFIDGELRASLIQTLYKDYDGDFDVETDIWVDETLPTENIVRRTMNLF